MEDSIVLRRQPLLLLLFLALCSFASAQIPNGNVFFGYSYLRADLSSGQGSNLNGWEGSLEGKVFPMLGVVVDISGHYGGADVSLFCIRPGPCPPSAHLSGSEYNVLFGPRLSASISKFRPFGHVLIGLGHVSASGSGFSNSDSTFATVVGGGLDYRIVHGLAWRFQGDYLQTRFFSGRQDNARLSTGLVLKF